MTEQVRFLRRLERIGGTVAVVVLFALIWLSHSVWPFAGFCVGTLFAVWMLRLDELRSTAPLNVSEEQ